jgi:hypothetical protein
MLLLLKMSVPVLREEWRVMEFARPPGQTTRSSDKVIRFKKFSLKLKLKIAFS